MGFDVHAALAAGYTPDEVEAYLLQRSQPWAQPAPQPVAPSFGPPAAAPLRPAPAPAPAPQTRSVPRGQSFGDVMSNVQLYDLPQSRSAQSLYDLINPSMMQVTGSTPVSGMTADPFVTSLSMLENVRDLTDRTSTPKQRAGAGSRLFRQGLEAGAPLILPAFSRAPLPTARALGTALMMGHGTEQGLVGRGVDPNYAAAIGDAVGFGSGAVAYRLPWMNLSRLTDPAILRSETGSTPQAETRALTLAQKPQEIGPQTAPAPETGLQTQPVVLQDFVADRGGFAAPARLNIRSMREVTPEEIQQTFFPDYGPDRLQVQKLRTDAFMGAVQPGRQVFRLQFADEHGRHASAPEGIEERLGLASGERYHGTTSGANAPSVAPTQPANLSTLAGTLRQVLKDETGALTFRVPRETSVKWAIDPRTGKVLLKRDSGFFDRHVDWFQDIGLPHTGEEFDRIPRGNVMVGPGPEGREIIDFEGKGGWTTDSSQYRDPAQQYYGQVFDALQKAGYFGRKPRTKK